MIKSYTNGQTEDFYINNTEKFIEDFYGIDLKPYQKLLYRTIYKKQTINLIKMFYIFLKHYDDNKIEDNLSKRKDR